MSEETKPLNLYQRINEVRKAVGYVQKTKAVETYKAVTHDQVTAIIRSAMIEHGIVRFPTLVVSESIVTGKTTSKGTPYIRYEATYDLVYVNADNPEDKLMMRIQAHSEDTGDKAPGKAISYAVKYGDLKLIMLESGEEEESRYQDRGEFPLEDHLAALEAAITPEDLQASYLTAKAAAMAWPDPAAFKVLGAKTKTLLETLKGKP